MSQTKFSLSEDLYSGLGVLMWCICWRSMASLSELSSDDLLEDEEGERVVEEEEGPIPSCLVSAIESHSSTMAE